MPTVNAHLLDRLMSKLGVGRSQVYRLIDAKVRETSLPRPIAAIALAADNGLNISRYASAEDLATIRQGRSGSAPVQPVVVPAQARVARRAVSNPRAPRRRRGNSVFVVHGRDEELRRSMFRFLRAVGLSPIEWQKAIAKTGKATPYVGEILDTAFREAAAVVVLLDPEDEAKLMDRFVRRGDPPYETDLTGQARQNVLFEAGMAFGKNPDSTILVNVGDIRPFSDIGGRHVLHLSNSVESRSEFITKLANAGANVDTSGTDWMNEGNFEL